MESDIDADGYAAQQALTWFERLPLRGDVIVIGKRVEAFALSERLSSDTLVVQVEKATPRVPGSFALVTKQTATRCPEGIEWINRGQDLGIAGLRRAKRSFYPDHLVEKYVLTLHQTAQGDVPYEHCTKIN